MQMTDGAVGARQSLPGIIFENMADLKVVLVEHAPGSLAVLKEALWNDGLEITICSGGFDALDELGSQGADLVIASSAVPI